MAGRNTGVLQKYSPRRRNSQEWVRKYPGKLYVTKGKHGQQAECRGLSPAGNSGPEDTFGAGSRCLSGRMETQM